MTDRKLGEQRKITTYSLDLLRSIETVVPTRQGVVCVSQFIGFRHIMNRSTLNWIYNNKLVKTEIMTIDENLEFTAIRNEVYYDDDSYKHGTETKWHWKNDIAEEENKYICKIINWKHGKKHGIMQEFHDKYNLHVEIMYVNNNAQGEVVTWYKNGTMHTKKFYIDDKKEGLLEAWYDNGIKKCEAFYKKGRLHGKLTTWYISGAVKGIYNYKNGLSNGLCSDYNDIKSEEKNQTLYNTTYENITNYKKFLLFNPERIKQYRYYKEGMLQWTDNVYNSSYEGDKYDNEQIMRISDDEDDYDDYE